MFKPLPETLKKIEERNNRLKAEYLKKKDALVAEAKAREARIQERAKKYAAEFVASEKKIIADTEKAEQEGAYYIPAEAKVALVVRIRGLNKTHPRIRKILRLFRLRQKNNATFIRLNKASIEMLKLVDNYVAYGYPSVGMVRKLICQHGSCEINGQRLPLTTNELVRAGLGHVGIESVEDLAHEIYTCGPNFTVASRFIWPFKLASPKGGMRKVTRHYIEGGAYGNREHLIDALVERMI